MTGRQQRGTTDPVALRSEDRSHEGALRAFDLQLWKRERVPQSLRPPGHGKVEASIAVLPDRGLQPGPDELHLVALEIEDVSSAFGGGAKGGFHLSTESVPRLHDVVTHRP
ncbi:MAG: hypothetical protein ABJA74_05165 [Lapillicoccus sp.]